MLRAWLSHCTEKERAPDPAQGKVLTELHWEKVKCAYTHGRTHAHTHATSLPTQSPRHAPCKDTRDTHAGHKHTHTHIHSLTGLSTPLCTTFHTTPKNSELL